MKIKEQLKQLPQSPGIYKMLNDRSEIIYIGKAKNLKKRVSSYFSKTHDDIKTQVLVKKIVRFETIVTSSEKEALILENQLIKTYKPRYNILLKDDKTYPYIKITTHEPFPKIIISREKKDDNCTYFGPYPSIGSTRKLRRLLYDLFPIRDCKKTITLTEKQPKCLLLDIEKCIGPCLYKDTKQEYDGLVKQLIQFLSGKEKRIARDFKKKMLTYSKEEQFEKAASYRDKLFRVNQLMVQQQVYLDSNDTLQIWAAQQNNQFFYLTIQDIVKGQLLYQHGFFEEKSDITYEDFIEQALISILEKKHTFPDQLICDDDIYNVLKHIITLKKDVLFNPKIGEKKKLLDNAKKNSVYALDRLVIQSMKEHSPIAIEQLQHDLSLNSCPNWILGFDISHLQGKNIVASSVSFREGKPEKKEYRKFNINTVTGHSNDPQSMYEVVYRRLRQCKETGELPDLLLIDGGRGQLNFALKAVYQLELQHNIELVGLAKREEECYLVSQKKPIRLSKQHAGLQLLQRVRDEAHRFAVSFQRKKRSKSDFLSELMSIPGVGVKRLNKLLGHYASISDLKRASIDDVCDKTSLSRTVVEKIKSEIK